MNAAARVNRPSTISVPVTVSMTAPIPITLRSSCWPGAAPGGNPNSLTRPWDRNSTPATMRSAASRIGSKRASPEEGIIEGSFRGLPAKENPAVLEVVASKHVDSGHLFAALYFQIGNKRALGSRLPKYLPASSAFRARPQSRPELGIHAGGAGY